MNDEEPVWECAAGTVRGWRDGEVWRATGIRHARAERFGRPEAVPPGDVDATRWAPACPQTSFAMMDDVLAGVDFVPEHDEDCLRVSVTLPAGTPADAALPVMVWIHGGSYVTGAGDLPIYDPRALVLEQQVIVVNVTYRLGLFGYLGRGNVPANLGLLDQISALRWVQASIAAFGGDPRNVTLFGESAGGDAIAHLMIADGARDLFRRAIIQSAPLGLMPRRARMYDAMRRSASRLANDASVEEIIAVENEIEKHSIRFGLKGGMPFGVEYGREPLPAEDALDGAWAEAASRIDVLIGHTFAEAALFVPARISSVRAVGPTARRRLVERLTQVIYARPSRAFIARHAAAGGHGAHYRLTIGSDSTRPYAGAHTTDLPLILGDEVVWAGIARASGTEWSTFDAKARQVRGIWAAFARDGSLAARADDLIEVEPVEVGHTVFEADAANRQT